MEPKVLIKSCFFFFLSKEGKSCYTIYEGKGRDGFYYTTTKDFAQRCPNTDSMGGITAVVLVKGFRRYTVEQLAGKDAK